MAESAWDRKQAWLRNLRRSKLGKEPLNIAGDNNSAVNEIIPNNTWEAPKWRQDIGSSYVVQPGDSWFSIAEKLGGSQFKAQTLARWNSAPWGKWNEAGDFTPGLMLRPGMRISVPKWFGGDWQGKISSGFLSGSKATLDYWKGQTGWNNKETHTSPSPQAPWVPGVSAQSASRGYWQSVPNIVYWYDQLVSGAEVPDWVPAGDVNFAYDWLVGENPGVAPESWSEMASYAPIYEQMGLVGEPPVDWDGIDRRSIEDIQGSRYTAEELDRLLDDYYRLRGEKFPNYWKLNAQYFMLPSYERAKFLYLNPSLREAWQFKDDWKTRYPELFDTNGEAVFPKVDVWGWNQSLVEAIGRYYWDGEPLGKGAWKLLGFYWKEAGEPVGSMALWLDEIVAPVVSGGWSP